MEVPAFSWFIVGIGPILVLGVALYASFKSDLTEIKENWVKYRCYPNYMPFASSIDPTVGTTENFMYCMNLFGKAVLDTALDPIYSLFDVIGDLLTDLTNSTNVFRTVFVKISTVLLSTIQDVFGKILNVFSSLIGSLSHVQNIAGRVTSSAWYLAFVAQSSIDMIMSVFTFVYNLVKGIVIALFAISVILSLAYPPILAFAITLGTTVGVAYTQCFHPDTPIELRMGDVVRMKNVRVGDVLKDGQVVDARFVFKKDPSVKMFTLNGVIVSGYHKVLHNEKYIFVSDHPDATVCTDPIHHLISLSTSDHTIHLNGTTFTDYEEDSSTPVMDSIEKIVGLPLTGYTMIDPHMYVILKNGKRARIDEVRPGDELKDGHVSGVVHVSSSRARWVKHDEFIASEHQLVEVDGKIVRAGNLPGVVAVRQYSQYGVSLIVDNPNGLFTVYTARRKPYIVRDYMDSHDPDIQDKIDELVFSSLNGKNAVR